MLASRIIIKDMILQETGTYGPQYARPYNAVTSYDVLENLNHRIEETTRMNPTAKINGSLIAGLSSGLVMPSANWERELAIPYGWSERRLRFILEVEAETGFGTEIYFFQGYTEYLGVSHAGSIDPEMVFYINSFMRINRSRDFTGLSSAGFRDVITETAQVINGRFHSQNNGEVYGLRPEDLFTGVQSSYLSSALSGINEGSVIDTRINRATDVFRSRRTNAIPSNFLSNVIDTYRTANSLADFGQSSEDIYSRAIQTCHEASPYENPFIRSISEIKGMQNVTYFTMNDLFKIDNGIASKTHYNPITDAVRLTQVTDNIESWGDASIKTQLATVLSNAVSGLMVENMLIAITFTSTNMTLNAQPDTRIMYAQGVTTADMRQYHANFVRRFETEVLPDITHQNTIPISVLISADLYGETKIEIGLDGEYPTPYVTPSWGDALLAPVVTTNQNEYHGLITGVEHIVQNVTSSAGPDLNTMINNYV